MMRPWKAPIRRAGEDADQQGDDPGERAVEAEIFRQDLCLRHAHDHGAEAEHGADRQVDVAGHDDQHHAGRHDRDVGRLDREVPEIARRQEQTAGDDVESRSR